VDTHGPKGIRMAEKSGHSVRDYMRFEELVSCMLKYDSRERISPADALNHKFFQDSDPPAASSSSHTAPRSTSTSFISSVPPSSSASLYGGSSSQQPPLSHGLTNSVSTHAHNGLASSSTVNTLPAGGMGNATAVVSSAAPGVIDLTREEELKSSAAYAKAVDPDAIAMQQAVVASPYFQRLHKALHGVNASQSSAYAAQ
jgi:serine/threonine protein kinase